MVVRHRNRKGFSTRYLGVLLLLLLGAGLVLPCLKRPSPLRRQPPVWSGSRSFSLGRPPLVEGLSEDELERCQKEYDDDQDIQDKIQEIKDLCSKKDERIESVCRMVGLDSPESIKRMMKNGKYDFTNICREGIYSIDGVRKEIDDTLDSMKDAMKNEEKSGATGGSNGKMSREECVASYEGNADINEKMEEIREVCRKSKSERCQSINLEPEESYRGFNEWFCRELKGGYNAANVQRALSYMENVKDMLNPKVAYCMASVKSAIADQKKRTCQGKKDKRGCERKHRRLIRTACGDTDGDHVAAFDAVQHTL